LYGELMNSVGAGDVNNIRGVGVEFDSRAMRKVEDGQDVVTVLETSAISLGAVLTYHDRTLIKLH